MPALKSFSDHFSGHAAEYAAARPGYPDALFEFIAGCCRGRTLAWDCATGNGQAARSLAKYFDQVIATDASDAQICSAPPIDGVTYRVARAEYSELPAAGVDLVTVAQALHWFDIAAFFQEVDRVLAPGGVLAFWCYQHCELDDDGIMAVLGRLLAEVEDFWPAERAIVEADYPVLETPFTDLPADRFVMAVDWTADQLLSYTGTWSATKRYQASCGQDPVAIYAGEFRTAWGDQRRKVTWPIILRACRKAET